MKHPYARLYHARSPWRVRGTPIATVMLGSLIPSILPMIALSPSLPPLGFLMLLGWRLLRPELWPLWIGLPLGLFDDLATGHPAGTAMCLWTATLVAIDMASVRMVWRDYGQDWLIASLALIAVGLMSWLFMDIGPGTGGGRVVEIGPQMAASILAFPLVQRTCARLDRWRSP